LQNAPVAALELAVLAAKAERTPPPGAAPERHDQVIEGQPRPLAAKEGGEHDAVPLRCLRHLVDDLGEGVTVAQPGEAAVARLEEVARRPQAEPQDALVVTNVLEVPAHVAEQAEDVELLIGMHYKVKRQRQKSDVRHDPRRRAKRAQARASAADNARFANTGIIALRYSSLA
jgi:hypothetical protein